MRLFDYVLMTGQSFEALHVLDAGQFENVDGKGSDTQSLVAPSRPGMRITYFALQPDTLKIEILYADGAQTIALPRIVDDYQPFRVDWHYAQWRTDGEEGTPYRLYMRPTGPDL